MTSPATVPRRLRLTPDGRLDEPGLLAAAPLRRVLDVLNAGGEEARVVGGAVRNALLGLPVADLDIATTAEPHAVIRAVRAAGLRPIPTGLAHGTVTVLAMGVPFEVTTLRQDVETDGRHARVRFSRDFTVDAARRDFTVNALSLEPDGTVRDTVGGLADLAAGRVRFIGEADRRIAEDYLRILRFFRFHASYGLGPLDPEGLAAAIRHADGLARLSRERVRAELLKLLVAGAGPAVVRRMAVAGLLAAVLAPPLDPARLERLAAFETAGDAPPDAILRLAALAVPTSDAAEGRRADLRLSKAEALRLAGAAAARASLDPADPPGDAEGLALLFRFGRPAARDGATLAAADAPLASRDAWGAVLARLRSVEAPRLALGGAAVMARGVTGGRRVGAVLKHLQAAWIRAGFPQDPARLAVLLDAAIAAEAAAERPG